MRQMLNELGSVFARVTHAMTRTTKPDEDYCGPTNPHPRELRQFILCDVVNGGLSVLLTEKRDKEAARATFEASVKPLLRRAIEILLPLTQQENKRDFGAKNACALETQMAPVVVANFILSAN
jgi:hypothetical protein